MADIKEVIDMMVADGRPESEIIALIDRYNKDNEPGKTTDPASKSTDSGSESGSLGSVQDRTVQPNIVIPEVIGGAPDLTMEEFESIAKESEEESREKADTNKRTLDIKIKTGLQPHQYPNLQVDTKTEKQSHMGQVVDVKTPVYEQADLEKMEEITAEITSEYRTVFNSLLSDKLETLQSYSGEDQMTYEEDLNKIHNAVFDTIKDKYPGLDKRNFMNIVGKGGDGLFQTALNNVTAKDKERDDAENKKAAPTLDKGIFKNIFSNIEKTALDDKEVDIRKLNDLIRPKQRKLNQLQAEGGDANEINNLLSEIQTHKKDIQKIATTTKYTPVGKEGLSAVKTEEVDETLASSYMDNETTKYRQDKINEAKKNLEGTLNTQLDEKKINNPKLTDFEAHELLYKSKAYNLQQLWVTGNTEKANLKFNKTANPRLYNKLKEIGVDVGDGLEINVDVPLKDLFDAGYDGRDFSGISGFMERVDISEEDKKRLLLYESAIYRNRGELELLHKITYANQDPASFDHGGFVKQVVEVGGGAIMTRLGVHPYKADQIMAGGKGATDSALLEEYQQLGNTYNEFYKEDIAKGKVDELGFTPEQMKAIEKTFAEEVGEGFGHFVPMLIELGVISAATGATMTATGMARALAGMRNAGGWKKAQYHAIMTMVEEGKMFTAGFDPGAGAGFYAGGQLTSGVTPFKKRFKWMDPLFQKVVKGGPVGATSAQIAFNLETGIQDLLGNKDFQATFDQHYGDLTFKDVIVESIVFSIAGATHAKKTDFMSTRRKYDAMTELKDKMNELIENPTGQLGKEGVGRALETAFTTGPDGKIVRTRPEGYEMMSKEQQTKWEALNEAKKNLEQMVKVETTAIELDPNNKDFESNVDKMFTQPINETLKSVNKEFEGFKVEFTENAKDARFPEGADGAAFIPGKGKDPGTALFLKSKFTPEKMTHEVLGHAGLESYFNRNPQAEVKFKKNIGKLFEKFDFQAYDGTPLGEFINKNYSKEIGKGNNIEPREFFAYMFELLTDPKIYYQKVAPTFFKEAKQELLSVLEESTGMKPKIRTARQFVDYIGRLSMDARRGLNIQAKVARLGDLDDISFLGIEFVENNKKLKDQQALGSKDLKGDKARLVEQNIELGKSKPEGWREKMDKNVAKIKNLNKNIEISESNAKEIAKYKEREAKGIDPSIQLQKLRENNIGILNDFVNKNYKDVPGSGLTKAEFKNYVENNEFLKIINSYNVDSGVPFGAYLRQNIKLRTGNILKALGVDMESKIKTVSLDAPEAMQLETGTATERAQEAGGTKGIELVYELPVKQKSIDAVKNKIESLDLEKLDYKTLKDQAPEATKEMFGKSNANKAKFITDNWKTIHDLLPQNTSQITGKATGIENSILKDFYTKGNRVKMAKTGSKQGLTIQEKIPMTKTEFLNKLGIREKLDGTIDISSMNRNIKTSTIPAIINQTGKAITNQIVRRGLKENPSYNFKVNAETLANQIGSGKSEALASKLIKNFSEKFDIPLEKTQDIFLNYAIGNKSLVEKKYKNFLDKFKDYEFFSDPRQAALWSAVEVEGLKGKTTATKFMGDFNTYWDNFKGELPDGITAKDMKALKPKAFYTESKGNVAVDVKRLNKHVDLSVEFAKMLPKGFEKSLTLFDQLIGLHQRVTMEKEGRQVKFADTIDAITGKKVPEIQGDFKGFIMDSRDGSAIVNQPFTRGRERALENLGKNVSDLWKGIEIKFKSASTQEKGQRELAKAGGDFKKQLEIAEKYFTELDNKTKEDIYFAIEATKQEFIEAGKNKQEKLDRMEWMYNVARSNTNLRMGVRQTVPVKYVLFPEGPITEGKIKLEHLKAMVTQSIQTANLVASGTFKKAGKEAVSDFIGITSTKDLLDIVDAEGGLTNTSGLYRMALLNHHVLSQYRSVESGFKRTLLQDIMLKFEKEVGPKKFKELQKANKGVEKRMTEQLAEVGFASKDLTRGEKERRIKIIDNAIKSGRDKKKEARGMSTWDFDDTLATTKSGVRARIPNIDGKPKPNRKVVFLAGGAGSGKGNVIKKLNLEKQGFKIVNSDISLEWLKKNNGLPENMNDLTKEQRSKLGSLQHQARGIAKRKMMKYKGNADGVVVDGTGGSIKAMTKLVNEFKDKGYDVSMLFVETSLSTALARNQARAERSLLDKIVEKNHEAVQGNKSGFKTMFGERFMEVKTDKLKQEDAMPAELVAKMKDFVSGYEKIRLDAEQFATEGQKILDKGGKFDFSEFNVVTEGAQGPFFQKAMARAKKFGTENQFVLTARPPEAARPIYEFLKSQGLEIPLENITGLGNSTGEAKAMWMLEKFAEGYNDMYFADDAIQNVKAVRNVLNQLDIKSKVQQALASKDLGKEVNNIMEHSLDIGAEKVFSKAEAKVRGKDIKRRRVFMRDSAADLELLIEPLYGKGKEGIKNKEWFKEEFVMPFERGIRDYNTARQSAKNDYMSLRKQNKDVVKEISKPVEGTAFTNDMAMRVYLWNKAGYKIPDLAKTTEAKLVQHIANNPKLQAYAENFARITKQEKGLKEPGENWWGETMAGEVTNINRGVSRKQYLQEWIERKNEIFTEENLNKMESKLGTEWRENITDMFDRMETGRTRSLKMDRGSAIMMNYLNGGIGTIMNFNTRSAVLQTISTTNFLNMRENNPIAAARAMGNVKQFAKDFKYIMNSDMLKQRRDGLAMNVTEAEIASAAASSQNPVQSIISKVLKAGYLPTKMADSFAISFGGATFYRNRIKMYEKQGMKTKEAEKQAFLDFQVIAERTQQSSRADLLSKQQTSLVGRFILPFANTPMQMNRAGMKDILDISKGRYENKAEIAEKVGRISYYMGAQVAIFAGLQSALFAMLLNDDDVSDEKVANTKSMMLNTTADSMLRGFGVQGAVMSATKNALQEYFKQSAKPGFTADYSEVAEDLLNISPPIGSKFGMLDRAGDRKKWAKIRKNDEFKFELGNPSLEASLMTIQATTNAPVYSPYQNLFNMSHALSDQYETWQRVLMGAGWTPYSVGVETEDKKKKKKTKKAVWLPKIK